MTVRTRYVWAKLRECGVSLYGRRFSLTLKGTVFNSYVRPTILYGSGAWLREKWSTAALR